MRLSSLADYAVVMLAAAARRGGALRLSATCLAAETGVPLPTAQKLMGRLAGAGLLSSARGTGGGFVLAKSPETISLADIVEAVEGPIGLTTCVDESRHDCALEGNCRVRPHWGVVNEVIRGALAGVSLADLSKEPYSRERAPREVPLRGDPDGGSPAARGGLGSRLRGSTEVVNA